MQLYDVRARWNPRQRTWEMEYRDACALGLAELVRGPIGSSPARLSPATSSFERLSPSSAPPQAPAPAQSAPRQPVAQPRVPIAPSNSSSGGAAPRAAPPPAQQSQPESGPTRQPTRTRPVATAPAPVVSPPPAPRPRDRRRARVRFPKHVPHMPNSRCLEHVPGNMCLGTCAWEHVPGSMCLGACAWEHVPSRLCPAGPILSSNRPVPRPPSRAIPPPSVHPIPYLPPHISTRRYPQLSSTLDRE